MNTELSAGDVLRDAARGRLDVRVRPAPDDILPDTRPPRCVPTEAISETVLQSVPTMPAARLYAAGLSTIGSLRAH